jgi:hypothetical protein
MVEEWQDIKFNLGSPRLEQDAINYSGVDGTIGIVLKLLKNIANDP